MDNMRAITLLLKYRTTTYTLIFDKFSSFIKMHKTLSLRAISSLPKMCTILEKIVSVYGIFFFLVTFIIEESREKQIIKTKLDIQ